MPQSLSIIIGAGSGLGRSIVRNLAGRGHAVLLVGRSIAKLQQVKESIPSPQTYVFAGDMSKMSDVTDMFHYAREIGLPIKYVYCSFGDPAFVPMGSMAQADFRSAFDNNLIAYITCAQEAIREFQKVEGKKHLILVLSTAAQTARPRELLYTAAKWGARGFFLALRESLKGTSIEAGAVYPGGMRTAFWDRDSYLKPSVEGFMDPDDVAEIIINAFHSDTGAAVSELVINRPS